MSYRYRPKVLLGVLVAAASLTTTPADAQAPIAADRPRISGAISVQQAVETGLRESLAIRAMQAEARAAREETAAARAMTLPQVSSNTTLSTGNMAALMPSSSGVTPSNTLTVPDRSFADQNVTLMVPLYTGGRLGSQVRAAVFRERAAQAGVGAEQAATALMIRDAYYRALLANEMLKVAEARVAATDELVRNAQAQFEAGRGIEASVQRARAERSDAERMRTSARNDHAKMLLELKTAMAVSLDSEITLSDALDLTPAPGDVNSSLAEAARTRPEVQAARARLEAARAQVGAARGSLAPQVYGAVMADAFTPGAMDRNTGVTAGITVGLPLFDSGQRRAEVRAAEALRDRADADLHKTELVVASEVRQAWLDVDTAAQNVRTAQAAVQAAQSAFDVVTLRVQSQRSVQVEALDALAALVQTRANLAQALYEHSSAVARVRRAEGRP